ncbi:DUF5129 domain-containing protein [Pauljensenia sp. 27098_8_107]
MTSSTNDATNTGPEGRASRITSLSARGLLRVVVGALLLLVTPAWFAVSYYEYSKPTAQASNLIAPVVEIQDETHSFQSVDGRPLSVVLEGIGFLRPTHLVVLSTDNLTDDNLDEATLKYARAKHPEWIARNGYKWADGYFILAVSPTHRQVGTYFGEDIAPVLSIQESIQNAAKDDFRNGRWSQGVVAAVTEAAAVMPNAEGMSLENHVQWPGWKGWVATLGGIGILARGQSLRRKAQRNAQKVADEWEALERRRGDVERAFVALLDAGHYTTGLSARYECARAEYERVRARIAEAQTTSPLGMLSARASDETDLILEDLRALADADHAILAAGDFFALAPGWRTVWDNEVGPVFEDLLAADSISVKVRNRVKKRQVKNAVEAFNRWTNEQRDIIVGLGNSLERAEITPVQALDELDRIASESRARLTKLIGQALVADTSSSGRQRYEHWEGNRGGTVSASDVLYKGTYLSGGDRHEYNPASTIRLTANSAGVRLTGKAAERTGRFQSNNVSVWAYPTYLDRYVDYDPSSSSTSSADYGSSSGGFSGSGSSSSF